MSETQTLLDQLVRIDSVNPDLVPGGAGETQIAKFIQSWFEEKGFETHWLENTPGRPSVVGIARGTGGGKSLMLNGHIDTVTTAGMSIPALEPRVENGRLYGRGSYDMKCGVAAMLVAAAHAKTLGLRGDVIVACVADEENASIGTSEVTGQSTGQLTRQLTRQFKADAAIVCEPTNLEMTVAHKGFVWANITTQGKAAHGSRPDLGIDAIAKMGAVLIELEKLADRLAQNPKHALLGTGSVHASIISGGEERSSYPATCRLEIERRTVPGETPEMVCAELQTIIDTCSSRDPNFQANLEMGLIRQANESAESEPIVQTLRRHARDVTGLEPRIAGAPYWTDCAILAEAGIPSLLYGPSGDGAHAAVEWVDLESLETCVRVYLKTIQDFCA
jgi:acetylornithine deacetylase